MEISDAYQHCEQVVREKARNFSYGLRLLPPPKRRALSAVYALARRIDDIADGDEPVEQRLAHLATARAALNTARPELEEPVPYAPIAARSDSEDPVPLGHATATSGSGDPVPVALSAARSDPEDPVPLGHGAATSDLEAPAPLGHGMATADLEDLVPFALSTGPPGLEDPVLVALYDAARRYPLPLSAFEELIDGCVADVRGTTYRQFDELLSYCRSVAGSIGRLSLGVFGTEDADEAVPLADALGVALQITNILRDVREDRLAGRIYLPSEDLERFGCTLDIDSSGRFTDPPDRLVELMRFEADRARGWFRDGMRLLPTLDGRSAACTAAMAGIYRCLLDRIMSDPTEALAARLSLPPWRKAMVAARALAGAGR
ncbi:Phytoene/squalene synthetase [Streptosporangium subroseum]|uniref:Phytoene/squalene synthetase n=1 Tax=Streptosporangium subroseum TaxID=106412 RepID=A0A239BJC2_9ACTN|nr:squalene/phytoene synthase family protein [Streptosporangium subroseum]SNS08235.1 Phytoene/squalene synthetase [Streptosporangium subroseum]